ncbi:oxidoreductase [Nisaea acidiphila]|uniref:Oxidoreductase n=1 Tax=Nisaea acidiphila TaxID=1862145 RepID=A0A9J7AS94_9PROT|nr:oxidoreductase [Nisaea acidiphila]UUX50135.1 oxidoreductase [Nisaea acidiphila]
MLEQPFELPCGAILKNRIAKAAMSDDLGDGRGCPTDAQARLYRLWAQGGAALSLIGETQIGPWAPETYGNLVLDPLQGAPEFRQLTAAATEHGTHFWAQLGHAGVLAAPVDGKAIGPSDIDHPEIQARAMTGAEIAALPKAYARAGANARTLGFTGVEIHAAHGFLLSQFLSPFFNRRTDEWGGSPGRRIRLLLEVIEAVRAEVGARFPVAVKINATDQLKGGLTEEDALGILAVLQEAPVDLIDISGGAYFPGAAAASDGAGKGPYFLDFARAARARISKPLMSAGGFKHREEAEKAVSTGALDLVGLARALVVEPALPRAWISGDSLEPAFPRFDERPPGGVTAWYTERLRELASLDATGRDQPLSAALEAVTRRKAANGDLWKRHFVEA